MLIGKKIQAPREGNISEKKKPFASPHPQQRYFTRCLYKMVFKQLLIFQGLDAEMVAVFMFLS